MFIRSIVLKVMLIALAVGAAFGFLAILSDGSYNTSSLFGSSIVIVIASALLLPICSAESGTRFTPIQFVGSAYVGIAAAIVLMDIWARPFMFGSLMGGWFGYGIPALCMAAIPLKRRSKNIDHTFRLAENIAMVGAALAFVVGLCLLVLPAYGISDQESFSITIFLTLFCGVFFIACCSLVFRNRVTTPTPTTGARFIGALGIVATLIAVASIIWVMLEEFTQPQPKFYFGIFGGRFSQDQDSLINRNLFPFACGFATIGATAALWCLLALAPLVGLGKYISLVVCVCTMVLGGVITATTFGMLTDNSMVGRIIAAMAVIDVSALLACGVLIRLGRSSRQGKENEAPVRFAEMKCPRCFTTHRCVCGESACKSCGLVVLLQFRDDICPACQYNLLGNVALQCPECGRERQMPALA